MTAQPTPIGAGARGQVILVFALAALLLLPPLVGLLLAGRPLTPYLAFPPLTGNVTHAPFSWTVWTGIAAFVLATVLPLVAGIARRWRAPLDSPPPPHPFPSWGWTGLLLVLVAWMLAWQRLSWFAPLQEHTFTPLWLGYILVLNGLSVRRTGTSLLTHRPGFLLLLFPVSALFWWAFEFLNRFLENWHYLGVSETDPVAYTLSATLPFATVLPAVASTIHWLASHEALNDAARRLWPVQIRAPRRSAGVLLASCTIALGALPIWPDLLFVCVWLAPAGILLGLQGLLGRTTVLAPLARGDWRPVVLPALAGLLCGFFWELWNIGSLAHWVYLIPHVDRFRLFQMPVLGYAGYLPFGVTCAAVIALLPRGDPLSRGILCSGEEGVKGDGGIKF